MVLSKRILVIDPDAGAVAECLQAFKERGWEADHCENFLQALSLLEGCQYDIVIIEMSLPEILGTEAWRINQQVNPGIAGIITTNSKSLHRSINPVAEGAFAYLLKPLDAQYVCALIRQMLKARDAMSPGKRPQLVLASMYSLFSAITFSQTANRIYEVLLAQLRTVIRYDMAIIYVQDSAKGALVLQGSDSLAPLFKSLGQAQSDFVQEITSDCIKTLLPQVLARERPEIPNLVSKLESLDLESCAVVPFIGEKSVYGALAIVNKLLPEPSQDSIPIEQLYALAQVVAIALDRAAANEKLAALEFKSTPPTQA